MPKKFIKTKDTHGVHDMIAKLIPKHHTDLRDEEVKVDVVFTRIVDDEKMEGLTHQGYPVYGIARVVPQKERACGRGDVEIELCEMRWDALSDKKRIAVIDHELTHFEVSMNEEGEVQYDPQGRPKMGIKKHDLQFGWFYEVAERHGENAMEVIQATKVVKDKAAVQCLLPGISVSTRGMKSAPKDKPGTPAFGKPPKPKAKKKAPKPKAKKAARRQGKNSKITPFTKAAAGGTGSSK